MANKRRLPVSRITGWRFTEDQIARIKDISAAYDISHAELARRALDFAIGNPLFLRSLSNRTSIQHSGK